MKIIKKKNFNYYIVNTNITKTIPTTKLLPKKIIKEKNIYNNKYTIYIIYGT